MVREIRLGSADGRTLITNELGEFAILNDRDHQLWRAGAMSPEHRRYRDLLAKNFIERESRGAKGLEATVLRTRRAFLLEGPALHIFVVTLRCDHACHYCQVSRAAANAANFDMTLADAEAAIDRVFESPSPQLTIEFQGGEPALRFDLVQHIVEAVEARNAVHRRDLRFSIVSTLHHLSDQHLAFCRDHGIHISTSIDGAANIHDAQRPNPSRDSFAQTVAGLERARAVLGHDGIAAMPTLTRRGLERPRELVDTYRQLGFSSIFLRPLSPYGFALKTRRAIGYDIEDFVRFYETALDYILELNCRGEPLVETYASVLLRHIFTPFHSGYVDLRSPAGAGLGVLVYNYDGLVYPADEARMAARTGDDRFALGSVHDPLDNLLDSPAMHWLMSGAVAEQLPRCRDCAFVPYCGADPIYHAAVHGDPIGDRANSEFCRKHLGLFQILFRHIAAGDAETLKTFQAWAFNRPRASLAETGHLEQ